MSYARREFLKATGMLGMTAFLASCKNSSIARSVIDAGVPETKGMGSNLRTWARYPEKTDLMMLADRPPLLETPGRFFLPDLRPTMPILCAGTMPGCQPASTCERSGRR